MENRQEFVKFLQEESDKISAVRFNAAKDISELKVLNISQRREFFQHISIISITLLGVTFFTDSIKYSDFFNTGLTLLVLVVILVSFWFREIIDKESNELESLDDKYGNLCDLKINIIKHYSQKEFKPDLINGYYLELKTIAETSGLKDDVINAQESRRKRIENKPRTLDFVGEIIIFLFVSGVFFIAISILNYKFSVYLVISCMLLIFAISFQDIVLKSILRVSKLIQLLHTDLGGKK